MIQQSPVEARIQSIIEPVIQDQGFEIVTLHLNGEGNRQNLQIMIEGANQQGLNLDDCASISRSVSAVLDVEDVIDQAYNLEISSPGIDRPLIRSRDFSRFSGNMAKIELNTPIDGRRRFRGMLKGFDDETNTVIINISDNEGAEDKNIYDDNANDIRLPYADIHKAKLVMTDDLLRQILKKAENKNQKQNN